MQVQTFDSTQRLGLSHNRSSGNHRSFGQSTYQACENQKQEQKITESLNELIELSPQSALNAILKALPGETQNQVKVTQALVVRCLDDMDMRGATVTDTLSQGVKQGQLRANVYATVFPWIASGSFCIPILTFMNEKYILMQHNCRKDGDRPVLRFPSGYMHPKKYPSKLPDFEPKHPDCVDEAESQLLAFKRFSQSLSLNQARNQMIQAYLQGGDKPDALNHSNDNNLLETAQRELWEEVGLAVNKEDLVCSHVVLGRDNGLVPVIEAEFVFEKTVNQLPPLRPDGQEVDEAFYIPLEDIQPFGADFCYKDIEKGVNYLIPKSQHTMLIRALNAKNLQGLNC